MGTMTRSEQEITAAYDAALARYDAALAALLKARMTLEEANAARRDRGVLHWGHVGDVNHLADGIETLLRKEA